MRGVITASSEREPTAATAGGILPRGRAAKIRRVAVGEGGEWHRDKQARRWGQPKTRGWRGKGEATRPLPPPAKPRRAARGWGPPTTAGRSGQTGHRLKRDGQGAGGAARPVRARPTRRESARMVPNASLSGGVGAANSDRSDAQLSTPEPAFVGTPKAQRSILQNFTAKTKASPPLTNCKIHGSTVLDDFRTDPRYSQ